MNESQSQITHAIKRLRCQVDLDVIWEKQP